MTSRESITMHPHHQDKATLLERLIFNNRPVVIALCVLVSIFLFWQATQIRPSTSFEKMIPLQHPFIEQMMEHRNDLANLGNTVRISVEAVNGDIFDKDYMETLRQVHDEVFYIPGVDRAGLKSLWSPSVRWSEVTEEGFSGGEVIPNTYNGSQDSLDTLRDNVLKSGQVGRLVGNNFKSSIVDVPLLESYPDPQDPGKQVKLDYQQFSHLLEEKVRDKFQAQNPNVKIHIVGFAKKVGDLIDGLVMVAMFFGVALAITWVLLYWFTWCIRSTIAVLITTLVAVVWQLGLMHAVGFGLDPYSMLVPFLIFAIGISHGVQKINGIALQSSDADNALTAARRTFRQLFLPGMIAILADAVGFITLLIIDIGVIRELAIGASIGVAVIVFTNLILLPVAISYVGISKKAIERSKKDATREHPFWRLLSNFASAKVAPVSVLLALVAFAGGLWYSQNLKIGDLDQGAPELRPDSRYNQDNNFIISNYSTSSDVLVIMELRWQDAYHQFSAAENEQQLFQRIAAYSKRLGFEYCCYGIRVPLPVSKSAVAIFDTYPDGWMAHYQAQDYIKIDSTVRDGALTTNMIVWPDVDEVAPCPLWEDAREAGLSVGIAQSSWAARGAFGLLSIARHADRLTPAEIDMLTLQTHWLANLSHSLMSGFMVPKLAPAASVVLTAREREVLCWTAEGKTACEIGQILGIAERTVTFHVNNVLVKLGATNKVQAVVKAVSAGLIDMF